MSQEQGLRRIQKPTEWTDRERIRLMERLLYRISAERINVERRARLIRYALDVAAAAPETLDRRWIELSSPLEVEDSRGLSW